MSDERLTTSQCHPIADALADGCCAFRSAYRRWSRRTTGGASPARYGGKTTTACLMPRPAIAAAPFLMPPIGADTRGWPQVHDAMVHRLGRPVGPYRFVLIDGLLGSRDTAPTLCDAVYRTLREADPRVPVTLFASFSESAPSEALFDALLWGQCRALEELDRLRWPRRAGGAGTLSLGGQVASVKGERQAPLDTLVLHFGR